MATRTLEGRIGALPKAALSVHVAISQVGLPLAGGLEAPQDDAASMKETLCAKIEPIGKNSVCSSGSIGVVGCGDDDDDGSSGGGGGMSCIIMLVATARCVRHWFACHCNLGSTSFTD